MSDDEPRALVDGLQRWLARDGAPVERIETHISWVLLAGDLAYKLKKPVRLPFLDFGSAALRRHYCEEELRINRRLAPQLYLGLSRVTGSIAAPAFDGPGEALDHAVRMRRFPAGALLAEQTRAGRLDAPRIVRLAAQIAMWQRGATPAPPGHGYGSAALHAMALATLDSVARQQPARADAIDGLRGWFAQQARRLAPLWAARAAGGQVREGHGDLHLANLVEIDGEVLPFDAIEFDAALRFIDIVDDVAFTAMDLKAHGRADLAARFVDAWVEAGGDHAGLPLWRHALAYRALVRSLVTRLREPLPSWPTADDYLALALREAEAPPAAALLITHGLPGSGKSHVALQLLEQASAIRLRSDVERKRLLGVGPLDATPDRALAYGADATQRTYDRLAALAEGALDAGWPVIVDAAFLRTDERQRFAALAAKLRCPFAILHCHAPMALLRERVGARARRGGDPSEATLAVLDKLTALAEPLTPKEQARVLDADTSGPLDAAALCRAWLAGAATGTSGAPRRAT